MDLSEQNHKHSISGSIVKVRLFIVAIHYAILHAQRLLQDILIVYQSNLKEAQSTDYDNTAAIIMLDQYCQCPACELVNGCHGY